MSTHYPTQSYLSDISDFSRDFQIDSDSTNATNSDRPGPGRVIGNVYSRLGQRLEGFLDGIAVRNGAGPSPVTGRISSDLQVDSDSTNATDSDRPGLGRVVGNVYSRLGHQLEGFLNGVAVRNGVGPSPVIRRIVNRVEEARRRTRHSGRDVGDTQNEGEYQQEVIVYTEKEERGQRKDIKKLIRYAKFVLCCVFDTSADVI